nr:DUF4886 domain-containing protein [Mesonia phycicola]
MLSENSENFNVEQSTFPGMSLDAHLNSIIMSSDNENNIYTRTKKPNEITETEKKIKEKKWDIIILQESSTRFLIPEIRKLKVEKSISKIKGLVRNEKCKFILFKNWPSKKDFPKQFCRQSSIIDPRIEKEKCCSPKIKNLTQEFSLINQAYDSIVQNQNLLISSNGDYFYKSLSGKIDINLYEDNIHPNEKGSFLNACHFYKIITNNHPSQIKYIGNLENDIASKIKKMTD